MGSVGERHAEGRSVDNGPYPSRHSVEQQHMAGILSQHQYHGQAQAQAHCRAQPANEVMSPSWRLVYGHSPTYTTPSTIRGTSAIMPAQSPMCASVTTPTVHPPWTSGGSHQDQGHYCHNPEPVVYPQPALMQAYQPYTPPLATPAQSILSLVSETSSHVPQYTAQAYLNAPNGTPNPGAAPSSPDINISSASASGEPTPPSQQTRPNCSDRTSGGQTPKLSQRPVHTAACKTRPVGYEGDLGLLQQRCRRQGADEEVISFMDKIFASGVSLEALIRPLTDSEVETAEFGVRTGKVYTGFLALTNEAQGVAPRYVCRLCHASQTWKHSKDVLRHLRRDHFGLADTCKKWYVSNRRK